MWDDSPDCPACASGWHARCRWPELADGMELEMRSAWHPLLSPQRAVANDLRLDRAHNLWIITGSNMSGKSTFLRTIGVNVLLAQIGCVATAAQMISVQIDRVRSTLSDPWRRGRRSSSTP